MMEQRHFEQSEKSHLPQPPKGWSWTTLEDIAQINPKTIGASLSDDTEVTFLPMKAVEEETGKYDLSSVKKYGEVRKGYTPMIDGDVIFAKITPCMENGKIAIVGNLQNGVAFGSTEFHVMRVADDSISKKFLFYFLLQENFRKDARVHMTGSAGQLRVPTTFMQQARIPVPPLPEQHRIVTKIEELFSDLDAGVAELEKAKAQLKRYRQAVLKAAVEGKLTAEWRAANKDKIEPASVLLERIREERAKNANGKEKVLPPMSEAELGDVPEAWVLVSFDVILRELKNGYFYGRAHAEPPGIPILRINAVRPMSVSFNDLRYVPVEQDDVSQYLLKNGDLLFTRYNGTLDLVGVCGKVRGLNHSIIYPDKLIRARVYDEFAQPEYLELFFASRLARNLLERKAKTTAGQQGISGADLKSILITLPPLAEQKQIVAEVERRLSISDEIEKTVDASLRQAERLRQSILKRAFEGKLVPQDPSDEPAEKLLEKITQAKRVVSAITTKPVSKNKKADTKQPRLIS